jgi:hypothetical protein
MTFTLIAVTREFIIEAQMKTFHLSTFLEKNGEPLYAPVLSLKPSRFIKIR